MSENDISLRTIGKLPSGSLRARVYEHLRGLILANKLAPGQNLIIDQIAVEMGVSHTPVREALGMLELDGLVTSERNRTPRVTDISPEDVRDVYEMRAVLEGWAAVKAALSLTDTELSEMGDMLDHAKNEAARGSYEAHLESDILLHQKLTRPIGNAVFQRLFTLVTAQSMRIRSLVEARSSREVEAIIEEHRSILEALKARDPDLARARIVAHLSAARDRTLAALRESEYDLAEDRSVN